MDAVTLEPGGVIPFDRNYAIAHGRTKFDPERPDYLSKTNFLMLMRNPGLAAVRTRFDPVTRQLTASMPDGVEFYGDLESPEDREVFEHLLSTCVGNESRGGPPRIVSARAHHFFDSRGSYLSLLNLNSVAALGRVLGRDLDPVRFRANLLVSGMPEWEEANLVGRQLHCGAITFRVEERISRCTATSVNPGSAEVDMNVPLALRRHFGTLCMGLYVNVVSGGTLRVGETVIVGTAER